MWKPGGYKKKLLVGSSIWLISLLWGVGCSALAEFTGVQESLIPLNAAQTIVENRVSESIVATWEKIRTTRSAVIQVRSDIVFLQGKIDELREKVRTFRSNMVTFLGGIIPGDTSEQTLTILEQLGSHLRELDEQTYGEFSGVFSITEIPEGFNEQANLILARIGQKVEDRIQARYSELNAKKRELELFEDEESRQRNLLQIQIKELVRTLAFYAIVLGAILLLQRLSLHLFQRIHGTNETFLHIHKTVFHIIIIIIIIALISTNFLRIVTSLSIVATGLVIVLKEVILSYFAWFVITGEDGYQTGDMIEIGDDIFGRVKKIGVLQTTLQQLGKNGQTGRIFTFPNKIIFERPVLNWSRMGGVNFIFIEFLLAQESNISFARSLLLEIMKRCNEVSQEKIERNKGKIKRIGGFSSAYIQPNVHISPDTRGILIRGRLFVDLEKRNEIRTRIMEEFIATIRTRDDVTLKFVEIGEQ